MDAILQRLSQLSDAELRTELKNAGQPCGGIAKTTRKFFEKRLAKHLLAKTEKVPSGQDATDNAARPAGAAEAQTSGTNDGGGLQQTGDNSVMNADVETKEKSHIEEPKQTEGAKDKGSESASSDGPFYVVQVPTEDMDMDVPDAPTFKAPLCNGQVFHNRKEALNMVKKSKGARFKVFKSQEDAEAFVNSHQDLSTPKRTESVSRVPSSNVQISESANSFRSPKCQQLVVLRQAIEGNNHQKFREIVWNNPRYLISSGDMPTILKEGPRYNALHVTAIANLASMCRLILETLEDVQFFALMYPDDSPETQQKRRQVLVDMYLNTPDKGHCETPLHFASKFGNYEVAKVLADHPLCDKTAKNKNGETARQVVCTRAGTEGNAKRRIIHLLEDNYYVPVLRSDDNSTQPVIGEPWSPDQTSLHHQVASGIHPSEGSPVDASISTKAYAGPMSPSEAETFHKHLRTPPSAESKRAAAIRRADGDKGLERVARELARSMKVPWAEYWDFLDAYVDLTTKEGLIKLEEYLQTKQPVCNKSLPRDDRHDKVKDKSIDTNDMLSNLMEDFEKMSLSSDTQTRPSKDSMNRTSQPVAMELQTDSKMDGAVESSDDSVFVVTDTRPSHNTAISCVKSDGAKTCGESKLEDSVSAQEVPQGDGNLDFRVDGKTSVEHGERGEGGVETISAHTNTDNDTVKINSTSESTETRDSTEPKQMDLSNSGHQHVESGSGDNLGGLMETPKSRQPGLFSRHCQDQHVEPVYLMGNEPTKLDLDVVRAISSVDNLDNYPCVQQWHQQVEAVPEDSRKSWPTPAKYRSKKPLAATPSASPHGLSPTQRLLRYGSPIYNGTPSSFLMGSPHLLRSRHVSDPGMAGHQRRVYTTSPRGANSRALSGDEAQDLKDPRLRLFP